MMLVITASHDVGDADDDGDEDEENKTDSACDAAEDDDTCKCNHVHRKSIACIASAGSSRNDEDVMFLDWWRIGKSVVWLFFPTEPSVSDQHQDN